MSAQIAIRTRNLSKSYNGVPAVQDINLQVPAGTIYGYLGANGAGKTTTIRMLLNLHKPDTGDIRMLNHAMDQFAHIAPRIGLAPSDIRLYDEMTGTETLNYFQRFLPGTAVLRPKMCDALRMTERDLNKKVRYYSQGMKQKLLLIQAMQHDPDLLILDEPSERLDPAMQMRLYELLTEFKNRGKTVFFSSHNLPEVERICDYIGIIKNGRLIEQDALTTLKARLKHVLYFVFGKANPVLPQFPGAHWHITSPYEAELHYRGTLEPIWRRLSGLPVKQIEIRESALESFFMEYYRAQGKTS